MQILRAEPYRAMTDKGIQTFHKFDAIADSGEREDGFMTQSAATHWASMVNDINESRAKRKGM